MANQALEQVDKEADIQTDTPEVCKAPDVAIE